MSRTAGIRRALATAPLQLADGFARAVRSVPQARLDALMKSPARRAILAGIFSQMPRQLDRKRAAGMSAVVEWQITGRPDGSSDVYRLQLRDGHCRVTRREVGEPTVTISVDGGEFLQIAAGNTDPMQAYFKGRVKIAGDIMVAAKLSSLFRIPSAGRGA